MAKNQPGQKETIAFRIETGKKQALDEIAGAVDRDRSYIINEALDQYLAIHQWQTAHIEEGLRQARDGKLKTHEDIVRKWETKLASALDPAG